MKLEDLYLETKKIEAKLIDDVLSIEDKNHFVEMLNKLELPKISQLASRVKAGMTLEQFICFVVPIERELNNKVTDFEILVETKDKIETQSESNSLIVVLDNIRSPFNMGAAIRSCEALGVQEILITGYTPGIENETVKKISMNAWQNVVLTKFRDLVEVKDYLLNLKYQMVGVETCDDAELIYNSKLSESTALVFGNERFGLSKRDLSLCHQLVKLPVFGLKNSLNVNAALTACGYEWIRQNAKL